MRREIRSGLQARVIHIEALIDGILAGFFPAIY
jgi:hypothetical protein